MIDCVYFKNYKSYSGKTAVLKLLSLIEGSLSGDFREPISYEYKGIKLGDDFRDLYYRREGNSELEFKIVTQSDHFLKFKVTLNNSHSNNPTPQITYWANNNVELKYNYEKGIILKDYIFKNLSSGNDIQVLFNGVRILNAHNELNENTDISSFEMKTAYIGPLRVSKEEIRYFPLPSNRNIELIDKDGKAAYYKLVIEAINDPSNFIDELNTWYSENFNGWSIKPMKDNPPFEIHLARESPQYFSVNIADVGEGITQSLPVIVSAFLPNENSITMIEQPELHLHPSAHGNLAELFANTAKKYNKKYLIETHSQNFVLRLRRLVAENKMNRDDLVIYWVDYDENNNTSTLKKIEVDKLGRVDYWPEKVFSESLDETIAIRTAQLKAEQNDS